MHDHMNDIRYHLPFYGIESGIIGLNIRATPLLCICYSSDMELPKWNELFLPALRAYEDGEPHVNRQVKVSVADSLSLPDNLRNLKTTLHGENKIEGRVGWAISGLKIAGLLENHVRGSNIITPAGSKLLRNLPPVLDEKFIEDNYLSYRENKQANKERNKLRRLNGDSSDNSNNIDDYTPDEAVERGIATLNDQLASDLLDKLRGIDPYRFEEVVADLLTAMGYGKLTVTQKSNDGGIDAIVDEDALGLDRILVQAKRYHEGNIINELAIRNFAGALATTNVNKGIFVTTSSYSQKAITAVSGMQIVLIDGYKLAQLMIDNNVGTSVEKTLRIRRLDTDYFDN